MSYKHIFGNDKQWAIGVDDGCLQFYPQYSIDKTKVSKWIWKDAYQEVEKLGGFDKTIETIRGLE